jgi:hypothetical protein
VAGAALCHPLLSGFQSLKTLGITLVEHRRQPVPIAVGIKGDIWGEVGTAQQGRIIAF